MAVAARRRILPTGYAGVALTIVAWWVSWSHLRPWSEWAFFPIWLGYILTVDALVRLRGGVSPVSDSWWRVVRLFAVSAVAWWIFEAFNVRVQNWQYLQDEPIGPVRYVLQASLDFSTVLPAIFVTCALIATFMSAQSRGAGSARHFSTKAMIGWEAVGIVTLILPLLNPDIFFPLIWGCLFFLIDPINARMGNPSLLLDAAAGRWRRIAQLALAGIVCGFFWEMWNSLSMPKWVYTVPHVPQTRLFEMPVLGYTGYIPFAFECFAVYILVLALWRDRRAMPPTNLAA